MSGESKRQFTSTSLLGTSTERSTLCSPKQEHSFSMFRTSYHQRCVQSSRIPTFRVDGIEYVQRNHTRPILVLKVLEHSQPILFNERIQYWTENFADPQLDPALQKVLRAISSSRSRNKIEQSPRCCQT